jgi:hypothetical protein
MTFNDWLTTVHGFKVGTERNTYRVADLNAAWEAGRCEGYSQGQNALITTTSKNWDTATAMRSELKGEPSGCEALKVCPICGSNYDGVLCLSCQNKP